MNDCLLAVCIAVAGFAAGWVVRSRTQPVVRRFKNTTYGPWHVACRCATCGAGIDATDYVFHWPCPACGVPMAPEIDRRTGRRVNTTEPGKPSVETWEWKP